MGDQSSLFEPVAHERPAWIGDATVVYRPTSSALTRASGFMSAYDYTLNQYVGCAFGCTYCYAASFVRTTEQRDHWGQWVEVKDNALAKLRNMRTDLTGVLGFRPIVILHDGTEIDQLGEVLKAFENAFGVSDATITIAEGRLDGDLAQVAENTIPAARSRSETMAAIKGLERTCVIWSTGSRWKVDESAAEFVHTVLTRAVSLVIIVLDPEHTDADILDALGRLGRERLLFWTSKAEDTWDEFCGSAHST